MILTEITLYPFGEYMGPSAYICPIQTNNMKFPAPVPLTEIAALIGARLIGNPEGNGSGINEIHKVEEGDLVFVDHPKYYEACLNSAASLIIINQEMEAMMLVNKHLISF